MLSPNLPSPEPIIPEVLIIEISLSDSPALAADPHQASDTLKSNLSEATSIAASQVSRCSLGHPRSFGPRWIYTPIIPRGHGHCEHGR